MDPIEEPSETEAKLTGIPIDETSADVKDGDYICVSVWGNAKITGDTYGIDEVERAELMPEPEDDEDAVEDDSADEAPVKSRQKPAIAILIGEKPKGK